MNWGATTKDAWFRFDAPADGRLTALLCGSNYDTSVVMYQGSCGSLFRIACDDDDCQPSGPTYQSKIMDQVVTAGPVYIRVGGYGTSTGTAVLDVQFERTVGDVRCWGLNDFGQCNTPSDLGTCSAAAAGYGHTVALRTDGYVKAWGYNFYGECDIPADLGICSAIAAGRVHTVALRSNGNVRVWGSNESGQGNTPADLGSCSAIAAGAFHTAALRSNGTVRAWGSNAYGQCITPADLGNCSAIAAGGFHTIAIRSDGNVRCWGRNGDGECNTPSDLGICSAIAGGDNHTVALQGNRNVRCWGKNTNGQCNTPADLGICSAVAAGFQHTVALRSDGIVRVWGSNESGQSNTPVDLGRCCAIAAGYSHTIALTRPDCDSNGVNDYTELAGHDCNANGIHDCTDSLAGNIEDCNNNGLGDSCEKQLQVLASSGQVGPIGALTPRVFTVSSAVEALEPDVVTIRIRARGDFSGGLEYIRVRIGSTFDRNALGGTVDCGAGTPWQEFTMSATAFNQSFEPDGSLRVRLDPSTAVDSNLCPEGTWVEVQLSYLGARSTDCNLNGVMDTCEIADGLTVDINNNGVPDTCETPFTACPGDFDGNNTVSGSDLGALLGGWGPCPPGALGDMDSNGVINGADLGALLGAWGSCDT
jgi:alpha-tubulin suppressor-like RCC1 family protein